MSKPGRELDKLTAGEARARPDWEMPANGTERQKRKWELHVLTWTFDQLDKKLFVNVRVDPEAVKKRLIDWSATDDSGIEAARHGNIAPLHKRYPHLVEFLKVPTPKGERGRYLRRQKMDVHKTARWAVKCIRNEIWPEHFGKKNRRKEDGLSAEEIAAKWLDAEVADIHWKPPGTHKHRAANSAPNSPHGAVVRAAPVVMVSPRAKSGANTEKQDEN